MLNQKFLEKIKNKLSEIDYKLYLDSFSKEENHGFSINLKKLSNSLINLDYIIDKYKARLIYKNDNYAYLTYDKNELLRYGVSVGKDPLHHVGLYYIQEPSASKVLYDVLFKKNDAILDLCASPGGKSIAALYNLDKAEGGFLLANEIKFDRAKVLSSNIERMGFDNAIVTCNSAPELCKKFYEYFDKVIVDAPCSGEGMFRKSEEARTQWSQSLVESCASIQKELLDYAYKMIKNGGILIYSTCTFSNEEDEDNVDYLLSKYNNLKILHMEKNYPFNSIGEGQYFAIIKKGEGETNYINSFPKLSDLKGLNVLRYGLKLYEDKGERQEPSHASTHNDNVDFDNVVDLSDKEIANYLHGDVIRKDNLRNGWCKITYKNIGVGLGKVVNGTIKNHYPKGLRNV